MPTQNNQQHWMMTPSWRRGTAALEDEWIIVRDLQSYSLEAGPARRDLPFELAGIRSPLEAVAFADRYGLLREAWPQEDLTAPLPVTMVRERYTDWEREIRNLASVVSLYVELNAALAGDEESERSLREVFRELTTDPPLSKIVGSAWLEMVVNDHIAERIEAGREGVTTRFRSLSVFGVEGLDDDDPTFGLAFVTQSKTLIGTIYQQLAVLMSDKQPMRYCQDCGRVFLQRTRRQRFCNETCANRTRSRRNMAEMRARASSKAEATVSDSGERESAAAIDAAVEAD